MAGYIKYTFLIFFFVSHQLLAEEKKIIAFKGDQIAGALLIGFAPNNFGVQISNKPVRVSSNGTFLVGLGRDYSGPLLITLINPNGIVTNHTLVIKERQYGIQRIDGLPTIQVTPDPENLERIAAEFELINEVRRLDNPTAYFEAGFQWPVEGIVSGDFGSQRILNGIPKRPHNGLDIAAPEGSDIVAMAGGKVALVHHDMFYTGMTVMIDHGHGLTSIYAHMSDIAVHKDQVIKKGAVIGKVGKTGRATGYHLHWGITLFGTHLDPALLREFTRPE